MSKLKSSSTSNIMVYNPDLLSKQELVEQFVARVPLLNRIIEDLRKSGGEGGNQHHLLIGQRGAGKTTLLRRIAYAIEDDAELSKKWIPLIFREEQVNVFRLSDFWVNCLDALSDYYERMKQTAKFEKLDDEIAELADVFDEKERAKKALDKLIERAREEKRGLILLIDNLDLILDRLPEDHWTIREIMSHDKELLFIGATASAIESTYEYKGAFYDFFRTHELRGLSEKEAKEVLLNIAKLKNEPQVERILAHDPARFKTLHILTGGNPRTIILLYTLLARGKDGNVNQDLESLLDSCTPLYQDRVAALSTQAQLIVDTLALRWHPATAADIAKDIRFDVNPTSAQIARLVNQGLVEKVLDSPNGKTLFQITERFFNIWYLMRASRRVRRRLIWLVEFLKLFYTSSELHSRGRRFLGESSPGSARDRTKRAEYGFALAQSVSDSPISYALESKSVRLLFESSETSIQQLKEMLDLDGEDKHLQPIVDRHAAIKEIKDLINARKNWGDCTAEEFCDLLIGDYAYPLALKQSLARGLNEYSQEQLQNLIKELRKREQYIVHNYGSEAHYALKRALCEGYLESAINVEQAKSAALAVNYPALEPAIYAIQVKEFPTEENINRLQNLFKEFETSGAWNILGNVLSDLERLEEAEQAYRRAIEIDPNDADASSNLGDVLSDLERFDEAEQAYRRALEIDVNNEAAWNGLGNVLSDFKRFEEAEQAYRRALEIDPKFDFAFNGLGNVLSDFKRFEEAEQAYRRAIEIDANNDVAWFNFGILLRTVKRFEEAEQAYRRAIEIDANNEAAWFNLGNVLSDLERFDEAEQAYRRALEIDVNNEAAWNSLGNVLSDFKRFEEAEQAYRRAIEIDANNDVAWFNFGILLRTVKRFEEAEQAYRRAIEIDANNEAAWFNLGNVLSDLERLEEAEQAYRRALEIDPKFDFAFNGLGNVLSDFKRFEEAEQAYRRAIEIDANNDVAWFNFGILLRTVKRFEEAEQAYRRAIEIDANNEAAWFNLGNVLSDLERLEEAEQAYRRAIEIDPNDADASSNLGDVLSDLERFDEAEQAYRRALEIEPNDAVTWFNLGIMLGDLKRFEEAEQAFRQAIEIDPNDTDALNSLAWLLFGTERATNDAEQAARKANEIEQDNPFFIHTLACILLRQGKWEEAENLARRFITEADEEFHKTVWLDIVTFFKEAVAKGYAANAVELLRATGNDERWKPLYEALKVIAEGSSASLYRLSPEIRMPAEEVIKQIAPDFSIESADRLKKAKKKPVRRKRIR